jgi:hypothetical protein
MSDKINSILALRDIYLDHQAAAEATKDLPKEDGWNIILGSTVELDTNMSLYDAILKHTELYEDDIDKMSEGKVSVAILKARPPYYATKDKYSSVVWVYYFQKCANALLELSEVEEGDVPGVVPMDYKIFIAPIILVVLMALLYIATQVIPI